MQIDLELPALRDRVVTLSLFQDPINGAYLIEPPDGTSSTDIYAIYYRIYWAYENRVSFLPGVSTTLLSLRTLINVLRSIVRNPYSEADLNNPVVISQQTIDDYILPWLNETQLRYIDLEHDEEARNHFGFGIDPPQDIHINDVIQPEVDVVAFDGYNNTHNNPIDFVLPTQPFQMSEAFRDWMFSATMRNKTLSNFGNTNEVSADLAANIAPSILPGYSIGEVQSIIDEAVKNDDTREEFTSLMQILDLHRQLSTILQCIFWTGIAQNDQSAATQQLFTEVLTVLEDVENHFYIWRITATLPINFYLFDLAKSYERNNIAGFTAILNSLFSSVQSNRGVTFSLVDFLNYLKNKIIEDTDPRWNPLRRRFENVDSIQAFIDGDVAAMLKVLFPNDIPNAMYDVFTYITRFSRSWVDSARLNDFFGNNNQLGYVNRERDLYIALQTPSLYDLIHQETYTIPTTRLPFFRDFAQVTRAPNPYAMYEDLFEPVIRVYLAKNHVSNRFPQSLRSTNNLQQKRQNLYWFLLGTRAMVISNIKMNQLCAPMMLLHTPLDRYITQLCGELSIPIYVIKMWMASQVDTERILAYLQMNEEQARNSVDYERFAFAVICGFIAFWRRMNVSVRKDTFKQKTFRKVIRDRIALRDGTGFRDGYRINIFQTFPFLTGCSWMDPSDIPQTNPNLPLTTSLAELTTINTELQVPRSWVESSRSIAEDIADILFTSLGQGNIPQELSMQTTFSRVVGDQGTITLDPNNPFPTDFMAAGQPMGYRDLMLDYRVGRSMTFGGIVQMLRGLGVLSARNRVINLDENRRNLLREWMVARMREYLDNFVAYLQLDYSFDATTEQAKNFKLERIFFTFKFIQNARVDALTNTRVKPPLPDLDIWTEGKWGKYSYWGVKNYKPIFDHGLCLLECFYFITTLDTDSLQFERLQKMMTFLNAQNEELRNALINGEVVTFSNLVGGVPIFIVNSNAWLNEPLPNTKYAIIVKGQHSFVNTVDFVKSIHEIDFDKKVFTIARETPDPSKAVTPQAENDLAWDIEAYVDNREFVSYCVCVVGKLNAEPFQRTFFGLDCIHQFIQFIKTLTTNVRFWTFNGRKFDHLFVVKRLIIELHARVVGKETDIIAFSTENLSFLDLRQIFSQGSLKYLANLFETATRKSEIDFNNINKDTYSEEPLRSEIIKYCLVDCQVLYELVQKYYGIIDKLEYKGVRFMGCPITTASLAMNVYKQLFIPKSLKIQGSPRKIYDIERNSYYGGFVNVFKKYGTNLLYYDINSSYPYSMCGKGKYSIPISFLRHNVFPFPGKLTTSYGQKYVMMHGEFIFKADALYLVYWKFKRAFLTPFFAVRTNEGLIYPSECTARDYRWGELINIGIKYDLFETLEVFEEIEYTCKNNVFTDYVKFFYEMKAKTKREGNKTMNYFYKLMLNSLYGKFGQRQFDEHFFCELTQVAEFVKNPHCSIKLIDEDLVKVTIGHQQGVEGLFSCVRIASRITAASLGTLIEAILTLDPDPIEASKHVWYVDTDSIVCDRELNYEICDEEELGKFKLEYMIDEAWFVSPKNYLLRYNQENREKTELKMKGVSSENFHEDPLRFFTDFLNNGTVDVVNKNVFQRKFNKVLLNDITKVIKVGSKRRIVTEDTNETVPHLNIIQYYQKYNPTGISLKREQQKWHAEEEGREGGDEPMVSER